MRDDQIFENNLQEIVADLEGEVFGETDEAASEAGERDGEGELDEVFTGEVRAAPRGCPPQVVNVDCPPPVARPTQALDNFSFDKTDLSPFGHTPAIVLIAAGSSPARARDDRSGPSSSRAIPSPSARSTTISSWVGAVPERS